MQPNEIVLPETKPGTEWVRGRARQKVSPKRSHARLQRTLLLALDVWARGKGEINPEWRFRLQPPDEIRRPLVPDLAYVRLSRLRELQGEDLETPSIAPDVAIEILSPGDEKADIEEKVRVYLASGTQLVMLVDPQRRRVILCDGETHETLDSGTIVHLALPGWSLPIDDLFAALKVEEPEG